MQLTIYDIPCFIFDKIMKYIAIIFYLSSFQLGQKYDIIFCLKIWHYCKKKMAREKVWNMFLRNMEICVYTGYLYFLPCLTFNPTSWAVFVAQLVERLT